MRRRGRRRPSHVFIRETQTFCQRRPGGGGERQHGRPVGPGGIMLAMLVQTLLGRRAFNGEPLGLDYSLLTSCVL